MIVLLILAAAAGVAPYFMTPLGGEDIVKTVVRAKYGSQGNPEPSGQFKRFPYSIFLTVKLK